MPTNEHDKRLRAELAAELGCYPARSDEELIGGTAPTPPAARPTTTPPRWAHLTELARQREVEQRGREEVADLYE